MESGRGRPPVSTFYRLWKKAELSVTGTVLYGHEATHRNAERITEDPCVREADMLLAVGGGKCLDTVKLAADHLGKPVFYNSDNCF